MIDEYNFEDIYIRHAIDEEPAPSNYKMHLHSRCEIYFFISGHVEYLVEGSCYPLHENNLMIMRPSESHTARIIDGSRYERFAVNFPENFCAQIDSKNLLMQPFMERPLGKGNLFTQKDMDMEEIKKLFFEMMKVTDSPERRMILYTHLGIILFKIFKAFSLTALEERSPATFSERVVSYINAHLFEEVTVSNLAEYFCLSSSQFTRLFKKDIGSSPWEYILRKRLTAARELLKKGSGTQSACSQCGFMDYSSFYRAYRKYFNEAPASTREHSIQ